MGNLGVKKRTEIPKLDSEASALTPEGTERARRGRGRTPLAFPEDLQCATGGFFGPLGNPEHQHHSLQLQMKKLRLRITHWSRVN